MLITLQTSLSLEALFVAETQIGIREEKGNTGPEVKRYLNAVGLSEGYPWCMAGVYWCVDMAAKRLDLTNPLKKTGGVKDQWNYAATSNRLKVHQITSPFIKPGFIFIMLNSDGTGHTGWVKLLSNGIISTSEGNTDHNGGREGIEWAHRERPLKQISGFIELL